jgi:uncharacterized protein (DUF2225 family)
MCPESHYAELRREYYTLGQTQHKTEEQLKRLSELYHAMIDVLAEMPVLQRRAMVARIHNGLL